MLLEEVSRRGEEGGSVLYWIPVSRSKSDVRWWEVLGPIGDPAEFYGRVEAERAIRPADRDEQTMLVDNVEVVDQPDILPLAS